MGFFSGITKTLLGGSEGSSSSHTGGFNDLPPQIKGAYTDYATQIQNLLNSGNLNNMYKPLPQTAGETKAYDAINKGFTPTQQSLNADIGMQMNPYDQYVIDEINRQAGGDYSILKQSLNEAGQFGSNRQNLGANDIDLSRLNQIGSFKRDAYNTALNNALTTLPGLRLADAGVQLDAAGSQRDLYAQEQQAPVIALQQIAQALGILPTTEGSNNMTQKDSKSNGLAGGSGGNIAGIGQILGAFSDINLKANIEHVGFENGYPIYEFNYDQENPYVRHFNLPTERYVGVLAQDIEQVYPEAVSEFQGYKRVNYDMIGVRMREA